MTLSLSATPTIVAREIGAGMSARWQWLVDDVGALRAATASGAVGTAQRRDPHDGAWLLLAWDVAMQREAAAAAQAERERLGPLRLYSAPSSQVRRVYKPACRPVGRRTHAPYMFEPAHW